MKFHDDALSDPIMSWAGFFILIYAGVVIYSLIAEPGTITFWDVAIATTSVILFLYCLTKKGYRRLQNTLEMGVTALLWLIPVGIVGWLVLQFFSLPPTTIIIILLLLLLAKDNSQQD